MNILLNNHFCVIYFLALLSPPENHIIKILKCAKLIGRRRRSDWLKRSLNASEQISATPKVTHTHIDLEWLIKNRKLSKQAKHPSNFCHIQHTKKGKTGDRLYLKLKLKKLILVFSEYKILNWGTNKLSFDFELGIDQTFFLLQKASWF